MCKCCVKIKLGHLLRTFEVLSAFGLQHYLSKLLVLNSNADFFANCRYKQSLWLERLAAPERQEIRFRVWLVGKGLGWIRGEHGKTRAPWLRFHQIKWLNLDHWHRDLAKGHFLVLKVETTLESFSVFRLQVQIRLQLNRCCPTSHGFKFFLWSRSALCCSKRHQNPLLSPRVKKVKPTYGNFWDLQSAWNKLNRLQKFPPIRPIPVLFCP